MKYIKTEKQKNNSITQKGFVAFSTILVVSVVTLGVAVSISLLGVSEARNSLDFRRGNETLKIAEACVEEALLRLRDDDTYNPGLIGTLPGLSGECTINVSGTGSDRTIDVTANHEATQSFTKNIQVTIKRTGNSVNIISWQEI